MYSVPIEVVSLVMMEIVVLILQEDLMKMSHDEYGSPERLTGPSDMFMQSLYRHDELRWDAIWSLSPRGWERQMNSVKLHTIEV